MTGPHPAPAETASVPADISLADLPLREDLRGEQPYGAPQPDVPVRLNVNENPYPPSATVIAEIAAAVAEATASINRYPDREFLALRAELGRFLTADSGGGLVRLEPENIWAANGSNEIMQQLLQAFGGPGRTALSFAPTYSMYPEYARNTHTRWVVGHRAADFSIDTAHAVGLISQHRPSVVILTSPNNPTGTALPLETVRAVLAIAPGVVIVDEAYAEFRRDGVPSAVSLLPAHPRLIVTRTMSKAFAYAGGRLGYLAATRAVVDAVRIVRLPYHLSAVAQAAAHAALSHRSEALARVQDLRSARDDTITWLREHGFSAADSDANFVLFGRFRDRHSRWQGLLDRGVLIRETGPDGWLRVSVGTTAEMAAFRAALLQVAPGGNELPAVRDNGRQDAGADAASGSADRAASPADEGVGR
ncbi:histidinol-phosphate transaminase [Jatrophihabitans telluris]|uniref:Histidinol-phosphate aminotransferase n=1 Tax=Jatrophihabitans telluris TaxID=2038343 RepID=A0ABY4QU61_9ACTN|nr:histidinol-phosphate transaminase [Jatrophihabitans telluris]UQX87170.1 histidinol-phosphate transaminase [Jatrophihabitans telluris]